ncbi:hypothetical protein [Sphingomicrobium aestuariivivum]|uniref:hypothetical protein n=1 Tax=Sphingomicrobium aestuariivivum TaxID=1582356 RepID=UPI001FD6D4B6|nr:hypothetical protein [Sphingomicrobium aestuariivivum]MCJ8190989.1 hypothetical protein [Sphingomicrobium aestuariivivum]
MNDSVPTRRRPVVLWFLLFIATLVAMGIVVKATDIGGTIYGKAMMLASLPFLIKAGLNAAANAQSSGSRGTPQASYLRRMLAVSLLYLGSLFAAVALIDDGDPITPISALLALMPGIAVAGYFWAVGRFLVEIKDEFLRMLQIRAALFATGISLSAASIWGFLENFGQVPHVDAFWWPIIWFFGLGLGSLWNKLTYGTTGECP